MTTTEINDTQIRPGAANDVLGVNAAATLDEYKSILGTSNEITVTHSVGTITLSTPQAIATTSSPSFQQLTLGSTSLGGVVFNDTEGSPKAVTIEAPTTVTSSYTLKLPVAQSTGTQVLQNDGSGNLSWSAGGGGGVGYREDYIVGTPLNNYTGSSTVFNLVNSYNVGGHTLIVTYDGVVMTLGSTVDYLETNSTTVTFNYSLVTGTKVSFIFSQPPTSPTGTVNSGTAGQLAYYASGGTTVSGLTTPVTIANGGTNSSTALNNKRIIVSSSGSIVENPNGQLTANGLVAIDTNGNPITAIGLNTAFGGLAFTSGYGIVGISDSSNATGGDVGEYIESGGSATTSFGNATYGDLTSIMLTPGDWDVSWTVEYVANGTTTHVFLGIGTTSGNSGAGTAIGNNAAEWKGSMVAGNDFSSSIPGYRINISGSTTYYLKQYTEFSGSEGTSYYRISARRIR